MTTGSILSDIKKGKFAPIYILQGDESYYIDEITDALIEEVLEDQDREFNQSILYGKDVNTKELIPIVNRFPMMAKRQLVVLKEAQDVRDIEDLSPILEKPNPTTVFVINLKGKKLDKRKAFVKKIHKDAVVFTSEKIRDYNIVSWIKNYTREKGIRIEEKSVHLLSEYLGNDLSKITNELDKLKILIGENELIDTSIIEKNIGISKDHNIWELHDALGRRDVLRSNRIISYFGKNPKAMPFELFIGSMYSFTTNMIKAKKISDRSRLMKLVPGGPYAAKIARERAQNFSMPKLEQMISLLHEYDLRNKGVNNGSAEQGALMQEMVFKILH